jgi:hypothetical protein
VRGGGVGARLGLLGDRDDRLLLLLGVAQEGDPVEQVLEPVRFEHDRDQVGLGLLVVGHELTGEQHARAGQSGPEQGEQSPLALQVPLHRREPRSVAGEIGSHRRLA